MSVAVVRAAPADAPQLVAIQIAAFHDDSRLYPEIPLGGPPGYDSLSHMQRLINEDEFYKILRDGEILGGLSVFHKASDHVHLDVIFVAPEAHGLGLGSQALGFLLHTYPRAKWTLDTPQYALRNQHFYKKFGFVRTGEFFADDLVLYSYERPAE